MRTLLCALAIAYMSYWWFSIHVPRFLDVSVQVYTCGCFGCSHSLHSRMRTFPQSIDLTCAYSPCMVRQRWRQLLHFQDCNSQRTKNHAMRINGLDAFLVPQRCVPVQ